MAEAIFGIAIGRWLDPDDNQTLAELVRDTLTRLRSITADRAAEHAS